MKITMLRNLGTPLLKKLGAESRKDELVEGETVDVPNDLGQALLDRKLAEHPTVKGEAKAAEIEGVPPVESPVANLNAPDAIDAISRKTSQEILQSIVDTDKRTTVVDAAKKRQAELQNPPK